MDFHLARNVFDINLFFKKFSFHKIYYYCYIYGRKNFKSQGNTKSALRVHLLEMTGKLQSEYLSNMAA